MALLLPVQRNASFSAKAEKLKIQRWGVALPKCQGSLGPGGIARTYVMRANEICCPTNAVPSPGTWWLMGIPCFLFLLVRSEISHMRLWIPFGSVRVRFCNTMFLLISLLRSSALSGKPTAVTDTFIQKTVCRRIIILAKGFLFKVCVCVCIYICLCVCILNNKSSIYLQYLCDTY